MQDKEEIRRNRRNIINTIILFVVISNSLMIAMKVFGLKYIADFRLFLFAELLLIALIVLLEFLHGGRLNIYAADKASLAVCGVLAAYTFISDIFVDKPFRFAGISIFAVLLLLGCLYKHTDRNTAYIKSFECAVQGFLLLLVLLSVFVKGANPAGRFSGPINNPSIYALYLGGIWAVLLGSLENHLVSRSRKSVIILTIIEMLTTLLLTLLSQSLTPLIAMFVVTVLWIFRWIARKRSLATAIRLLLVCAVIGGVCFAGLVIIVRNSDVIPGSRLLAKFQTADLSEFLSGRDCFWRVYLRKMNLLGHGQKPKLWGQAVNPHNALIGMMYMYGVPCVIPYILMFMMAIEKSYRYADRYTPYAAVPLYSIVTFVIMGIADNVEQPLVWLPTIACYLLMAPVLAMPVEEIGKIDDNDKKESTLVDDPEVLT